jgi:hypothetical protein
MPNVLRVRIRRQERGSVTALYVILRCPLCGELTPITWLVGSDPLLPLRCDGYGQGKTGHKPAVREVVFVERVEVEA